MVHQFTQSIFIFSILERSITSIEIPFKAGAPPYENGAVFFRIMVHSMGDKNNLIINITIEWFGDNQI